MASLIAFYEVALNLCIFLSRIETFMYGISFAPSKAIGLLLSTTGHSQTNGFLYFTRQRALARFGLRAALRRMRVTKALGLTRGRFAPLRVNRHNDTHWGLRGAFTSSAAWFASSVSYEQPNFSVTLFFPVRERVR